MSNSYYIVDGWEKIPTYKKVKYCKFCGCRMIVRSMAREICPDCARKAYGNMR